MADNWRRKCYRSYGDFSPCSRSRFCIYNFAGSKLSRFIGLRYVYKFTLKVCWNGLFMTILCSKINNVNLNNNMKFRTLQELSSCWDGRPFGHNRHRPKSGGCCAPFREAAGSSWAETYFRTKWHLDPSNRLWPQHTNVTDIQDR